MNTVRRGVNRFVARVAVALGLLGCGLAMTARADELPPGAIEVADGFWQNAATYTAATEFYITNKVGLIFFRDLVNSYPDAAFDTYQAGGFWTSTKTSFYQNNLFSTKWVKLLNDVDLNYEEWTPIGNTAKFPDGSTIVGASKPYFYGNFNGCGKTISNLKVTGYSYVYKDGAGLFGVIMSSSTIKDLTIENVDISAASYAGALIGNSRTSSTITFTNVNVVGDIQIVGTNYVGGLVGSGAAKIINCSVIANVDAGIIISLGQQAGGIYGAGVNGSSVSYCTVKNINFEVANYYAGGICGNAVCSIIGCTVEDVAFGAYDSSATFDASRCGMIVGRLAPSAAVLYVTNNVPMEAGQCGTNYPNAALSVVGWNVAVDGDNKIVGGTFEQCAAAAIADGYGLVAVTPATDPATFTVEENGVQVEPGASSEAMSQAEAEAAAASPDIVAVPAAVAAAVADQAAYRSMFMGVAVQRGESWYVDVVMTEASSNDVQAAVNQAARDIPLLVAAAGETTVSVTAKKGLYYSVLSGSDLNGMTEGTRVMATDANVTDGKITLTIPNKGARGFYRILVNLRPAEE